MKIDYMVKTLRRLKSKYSALTFWFIYEKGVVSAREIKKVFYLSDNRLKNIASELCKKQLIDTVIDSSNETYYVAKVENYSHHCFGCADCKFSKKKQTIISHKKVVYHQCNNDMCKSYQYLVNIEKIKLVHEVTKPVRIVDISKNKKGFVDDLKGWGAKEFTRYFFDKYTKTYRGVKPTYPRSYVVQLMNDIIPVFRKLVGDNTSNLYIKKHVDYLFRKYESSDGFNVNDIGDIQEITRTIHISDVKTNKKKSDVGFCDTYEIECSYWSNGKCKLIDSGIKCRKTIRMYMVNKYGQ